MTAIIRLSRGQAAEWIPPYRAGRRLENNYGNMKPL